MKIFYKPCGNPHDSYRQKKFILSTFQINGREGYEMDYADVERVIKNLKRSHHNQIELGWVHHNTVLKAVKVCEEEHMDLIVQDMDRFGGFQEKPRLNITEDDVKKFVDDFRKYPCVKGFYIWDEPWKDEFVREAGRQTEMFRKAAPGKLALSILVPSYNPDFRWDDTCEKNYLDYVRSFFDTIDPPVASFDYYPFGVAPVREDIDDQLDRSLVWNDLAAISGEAMRRSLPFWYYYQTLRVAKFSDLDYPMIRLQMNYALLYGAKGLQSFGCTGSSVSPEGSFERRKMLELDGREGWFYGDISRELARIEAMGNTWMALTRKHVFHGKEVLPENTFFNTLFRENVCDSKLLSLEELPFRCSVGEFDDGYGNEYLFVLNRDYKCSRAFTLPIKGEKRVYEVSEADGRQYVVSDRNTCLCVTLAPGSAKLYRLQDPEKEADEIEYICEDDKN